MLKHFAQRHALGDQQALGPGANVALGDTEMGKVTGRKVGALAGFDDQRRAVLTVRQFDFYRAFQYGAPPHGGMAAGVDRMVMLLCGVQNLREITLFPMNQRAEDLLMGAPSPAEPPAPMRWAMLAFAFLCIALGVWLLASLSTTTAPTSCTDPYRAARQPGRNPNNALTAPAVQGIVLFSAGKAAVVGSVLVG